MAPARGEAAALGLWLCISHVQGGEKVLAAGLLPSVSLRVSSRGFDTLSPRGATRPPPGPVGRARGSPRQRAVLPPAAGRPRSATAGCSLRSGAEAAPVAAGLRSAARPRGTAGFARLANAAPLRGRLASPLAGTPPPAQVCSVFRPRWWPLPLAHRPRGRAGGLSPPPCTPGTPPLAVLAQLRRADSLRARRRPGVVTVL
jgi:hypothetical protein